MEGFWSSKIPVFSSWLNLSDVTRVKSARGPANTRQVMDSGVRPGCSRPVLGGEWLKVVPRPVSPRPLRLLHFLSLLLLFLK